MSPVLILFIAALFSAQPASASSHSGSRHQSGAQSGTSATQAQGQDHSDMDDMDMGDMHHDQDQSPEAQKSANEAMSSSHMHMDAHMFMTDLRPPKSGDQERADHIVATLREAIEKYKDYHVALNDGFRIFAPNVPQPQYHFTSWRNSFDAEFDFDPSRPSSLLYKKTATGYELVGAMFTAPKRYTEAQLDARVPLSVARWHKHVNLCLPPRGERLKEANWKEFGLTGSIATESACSEAGGRWIPVIFNWMVHVYPYQTDPNKVWAH